MSAVAIWSLVPEELNGKFLRGKELIGFKSVSKRAKSAVKNVRGKIFDRIGEQLNKIIENHQLMSVPNEHKFKVKYRVKLGPCNEVGYIVKTTKKQMFFVFDGDVFKVGVNVERAKNSGTKHVRPYVRGEVKEEV
jgi:hypothetical protein